ncbi:MAG: tail fiber domain-containing protein [Bacteroidota bacterium]
MKASVFILVLIFALAGTKISYAQNIVISDDDGYSAHASAMLDVKSVDKGLLIPRMTSVQRTGISVPATGLLVFDTTENSFYYYNGTAWTRLSTGQLWTKNGTDVYLTDVDNNVGIGTISPGQKLIVKADATNGIDESIFAVVNSAGDTVFAVYPEGVRIWVNDDGSKATGSRGGFAVGGVSPAKGETYEFLRVTPDSVRVYIDESYAYTKETGSRGGFAVGGFSPSKGLTDNYLFVQDDSTRVYVADSIAGFGIASIESGSNQSFLNLSTENYFIGHESGAGNITGKYNVFLGYQSGMMNSNGDDNLFLGYRTGVYNIMGHRNIFLGRESGEMNNSGSENIFMGYHSGRNNQTGERNIFIGYRSGFSNLGGAGDEGSFNTFLGVESGLGNNSGESNTFIGYQCGYGNTNGQHNTYVGRWAGQNNNGSYNVYLGTEAGRYTTNQSYRLHIDARNSTGYEEPLIYGEFDARVVVIDGDHATIPGGYPNLKFVVNGNSYGNNWFTPSDRNLKTDILPISDPLDKVMNLNGVSFSWKDTEKYGDERQIGFIAQDTKKVIPEVVAEGESWAINYAPVTALLVEAMKEQQKQIEDLKQENLKLKAEVERISELEKKIQMLDDQLNVKANK